MAKAISSAAPPYAVTIWVDHVNLYMEIPAKDGGIPYIACYALSEGGLSKALSMMREAHNKSVPLGGDYKIPFNPMIRKASINNFSADQRDAAREILRKMGITG